MTIDAHKNLALSELSMLKGERGRPPCPWTSPGKMCGTNHGMHRERLQKTGQEPLHNLKSNAEEALSAYAYL